MEKTDSTSYRRTSGFSDSNFASRILARSCTPLQVGIVVDIFDLWCSHGLLLRRNNW